MQAYRAAIDIHPHDYAFHANLGAALKAQGALDQARRAYGEAAQLHDEDPVVHHALGAIAMELGQDEDAIRAFRRTIALRRAAAPSTPK